jgi:predicted transcriptional regulator
MSATIRLNVNISDELNRRLDSMSEKSGSSKSDLLRKAIVLMDLAVNESAKGNVLAVADKNHHILREIVGV